MNKEIREIYLYLLRDNKICINEYKAKTKKLENGVYQVSVFLMLPEVCRLVNAGFSLEDIAGQTTQVEHFFLE